MSDEGSFHELLPSKPTRGEFQKDGPKKSIFQRIFSSSKKSRTLSKHDLNRSEADVKKKLQIVNSNNNNIASNSMIEPASPIVPPNKSKRDDKVDDPNAPLLRRIKKTIQYGPNESITAQSNDQFRAAVVQTKDAIEDHRKIFQKDKNTYSGNALATLLEASGDIYKAIGSYDDAVEALQEAIELRRQYGSRLELACSLNDAGLLYCELDQYREAHMLFIESLACLTEVYGDVHPDVAVSIGNDGIALRGEKDFSAATTQHEKSIKMMETICGKDHEYALQQRGLLGVSLFAAGDSQQSSRILKQLLTTIKQSNKYPNDHPWVVYLQHEYDRCNNSTVVAAS